MIKIIDGFFDKLYFTECVLNSGYGDGRCFRIPVRGLFLLGGHPLLGNGHGPYKGEFVFAGVESSRREIIEYIGDSRNPEGFKQKKEIVDSIPFAEHNARDIISFGFEGYFESPSAWVEDWVVRARSFALKVEIDD